MPRRLLLLCSTRAALLTYASTALRSAGRCIKQIELIGCFGFPRGMTATGNLFT